MDKQRANIPSQAASGHDKPGIGIIADDIDTKGDCLIETINRIESLDIPILLGLTGDNHALRRDLQSTAATCIDITGVTSDPKAELTTVAKRQGLPGLIIHPDPTSDTQLDYEASVKTYYNADEYAITGHLTDQTVATTNVVVVIASEHDSRDVASFAGSVSSHADELLVVDDTNGTDISSPASALPTTTLSCEPAESGLMAAIEAITRQYPNCKTVTLTGSTHLTQCLSAIPEMVETVVEEDQDFLAGRAVHSSAETGASIGDRVNNLVRSALNSEDTSKTASSLEAGPQVLTPTAIRTLERTIDTATSRQQLIDTAIQGNLNVGIHEYSPESIEQAPTTPVHGDGFLVGPDSSTTPTLSVVMPTLNEEEGIRECIERITRAIDEIEEPTEIIVSDSSTDRTPEIAREMGATIVQPDEPGYGYAYRYAFRKTRGEYIVMGDADTTYDFEQIPRLLEKLNQTDADIVMGSRLNGEIKSGAMPTLHQYIGNPALTAFLNAFYDAGVSDAHSGFRIFTREAYEQMELQTNGMEFASEMIMDAGARDLDIVEVPIVYHEREGEETLDSFKDGWRHVRFMLVNAPGYLFSMPGIALGGIGVLIMSLAVSGADITGISLGSNSMIAGSLFTICGYQIFTFGLFSTIGSDPIRQPEDPITKILSRWLSLERGAVIGFVILFGGVMYAASLVANWITTGFASVPVTGVSLLSFTTIVLGLQTLFSAFFLSALADSHSEFGG